TVRDLPGKELVNLKAALTNGKTEIDISSLPAGIYFLQIELNSGSIVRKIIKE
ncbi:MAG: T9SS type A sorting domain-containing protein, partial [Bacteroidia bacterium]|nr:T9SS type A sorting domain-containing protein [Bacteroidia bacterium]